MCSAIRLANGRQTPPPQRAHGDVVEIKLTVICFAGSGVEVSAQMAPAVHDVGVTFGIAPFALSLGYRIASSQLPGNALALDVTLGR